MNLNLDEQQFKTLDKLCFMIVKYVLITYACIKGINIMANWIIYVFGQLF